MFIIIVRTWINLGHTNAEMFEITGRAPLKITNEPVELEVDDEPLIYRAGGNDPAHAEAEKMYRLLRRDRRIFLIG